jgi:hypothetical protein
MGLDMYLYASKYVSGWEFRRDSNYAKLVEMFGIEPTKDSPSFDVSITIGYWRKANAIHHWFVDNVQNGVDDCRRAYVSRDILAELRTLCQRVIDDPEQAGEVLPTQSGFFFGGTEYDEHYMDDLRDTIRIIDQCLTYDCDLYYQSSW